MCLLNNGTLILCFLGFLQEHFQLWSSSSHPLRLFLHSQQQTSPWICSPNSMFWHSASVHASRHMSQAGIHKGCGTWTICVCLTLFGPTQAGFPTLLWALKALFLSRLISPPVKMFFGYRNVSSPLATLFHRGRGPFLLLFFLLSLSSHLVT